MCEIGEDMCEIHGTCEGIREHVWGSDMGCVHERRRVFSQGQHGTILLVFHQSLRSFSSNVVHLKLIIVAN